jgi:chemotaxis protein CheX
MTVEVLPTAEDLDNIAEQVWSAFLQDGHEAVVDSSERDDFPSDLAASIAIVGAFEGHVIVACSREGSLNVASALFEMEPAEVSPDEVGDALGELVNVLGGNVKSMLPAPSTMSLPHVASTTDGHWPGTVELCRTVVEWRDTKFTLILLSSRQVDSLERVVA